MVPARLASSVVQRQVRYVRPVPAAAATGLVSTVYRQIAEEMRLVVPPAMLHSPAPDLLAAYWVLQRESLLPTGEVDRATKEAVAAAVSVATICPYCAEMHSVGLYDLSDEHDAEAIAGDRAAQARDPRLREVALWARHAHEADCYVGLPAGLSAPARAELAAVVVCMHYLTRMVNVFLSNFLLPPGLGPRARRRFKRGASRIMRPTLRAPREPGRSLSLLPEAPALGGGDWAAASPGVARALARAGAAFEAAGARSLPPTVRALVLQRLAQWRGEETGPDTAWCDELADGLPAADRAASRLALLTALASHQVSEDDVAEFRRHHPLDATVIEATGWASFAAARLIGERLVPAGSDAAGTCRSTRRPAVSGGRAPRHAGGVQGV